MLYFKLALIIWALGTIYFLWRVLRPNRISRKKSWVELFYERLNPMSASTKTFMAKTFGSGFTIPNIVAAAVLSCLTGISLSAEYIFLQKTLQILLEETPDSLHFIVFETSLYTSNLLSLFLCALSAIAGLVAFPERRGVRKMDYDKIVNPDFVIDLASDIPAMKVAAFSVLALLSIVEGYLGFARGTVFQIWNSVVSQIADGTSSVPAGEVTEGMRILNAIVSAAVPVIAAFTSKYLLRLAIWVFSVPVSLLLAIFIWIPAFFLDGIIKRGGNSDGTPPPNGGGSPIPLPTKAKDEEEK